MREFGNLRDIVYATGAELIIIFENVRGDISFHDVFDEPDILVVSDPTTVVYLCAQVVEYFIRDHFVLIQQHSKLPLANAQVFVCKLVRDIPSNGSELPPVLDNRMEEAETK